MKVAIIGSRSFTDYERFKGELKRYRGMITEIISGGALGTDTLASRYATEMNIPIIEHLPDWDSFGDKAPLERNKLIVRDAEMMIAFWDGTSRGTQHAISLFKSKPGTKIYHVIRVEPKSGVYE